MENYNIKENRNDEKIIKLGTKMVMEFVALTHEGLGIAKISGPNSLGETYDNFPIFVPGALPNEKGFVELDGRYQDVLTGAIYSGKTEILPFNVMVLQPIENKMKS